MKHAIVLMASANMAAALTQQCSGTAVNENGNYFCGPIHHILYQGVGGSGSYQSVKSIGPGKECPKETKNYNGPLAPFDEDVSNWVGDNERDLPYASENSQRSLSTLSVAGPAVDERTHIIAFSWPRHS